MTFCVKLSHLHFVSTERASIRLKKMGEIPNNVFVVVKSRSRYNVLKTITRFRKGKKDMKLIKDYGIVIYHPVTTNLKNLNKTQKSNTSLILQTKITLLFIQIMIQNDIILETINPTLKNKNLNY